MTRFLQVVCVWLCAVGVSVAWGGRAGVLPWQVAESPVRLKVAVVHRSAHTLRVPVPEEYREGFAGAVALTSGGKALPVYLLRDGERLLAVEIQVPGGLQPSVAAGWRKALILPVEVYLTPNKGQEMAAKKRSPVAMYATQARVIARPRDGAGMVTYFRRLRDMKFRTELPNLSGKETLSKLSAYVEEKKQLHYRLETYMSVDSDREVSFGVLNEGNGAWYVFVDEQPVFSWGNHERDENRYLCSKRFMLDKGVHRVDLFGILDEDEAVPTLAMREVSDTGAYQQLTTGELWSPHEVLAMSVEEQEDVLVPGYYLSAMRSYAFTGTETGLVLGRFRDLTRNVYGREVTRREITLGGQPYDGEKPFFSVYLPVGERVSVVMEHEDELGYVSRLESAVETPWPPETSISVAFEVLSMPHLAPAGEPVSMAYYLDCTGGFLPTLLQHGRLTVRDFNVEGKMVHQREEEIPASPFKRFVGFGEFPDDVARTEVAIMLDGLPVAAPVMLHHVSPEMALDYESSAVALRYRGGLAVLRRERAERDVASLPVTPIKRVVVADDYLMLGAHALEAEVVSELEVEGDGLALRHVPLHGGGLAADLPVLSKFVKAKDVLARESDAVVWLIGRSECQAGMGINDFRSELAYLVEMTLARGKTPVLATFPIHGEFSQERLRPYALLIMELAAEYDIPVVDLYSASLKRQHVDSFFRIDETGTWRSATPDKRGRTWFLKQIQSTIEICNQDRTSR